MERLTLHVKNMVCPSCVTVLKQSLENAGAQVEEIALGQATILKPDTLNLETIEGILNKHGFATIKNDDVLIVEEIKLAVFELIKRQAQSKGTMRNSDFIARAVGKSYRSLSEVFIEHEKVTIEKYIIQQKIKKTKDLLNEGGLSLSEIAAQLGYSSVQHLSGQFRKVEGVSVSDYKKEVES